MKPDDEYLLKLGLAHYWFQYVEWGVVYALHRATHEDVGVLAMKNPGKLAGRLKEAWKDDPALEPLASRYEALVVDRNHLAHSHPATDQRADGTTRQRLYRWDVGHPKRPTTTALISWEWLDEFIAKAEALNQDIQSASSPG